MAKTLLCLLTIFVFFILVSTENPQYYCKFQGSDRSTFLDVKTTSHYSILNLFPVKKGFYLSSCLWRINKPTPGSHLNLINVSLQSNDSLVIRCNNFDEILFQTNGGTLRKKLIFLAGCRSVNVELTLTEISFDKNAFNQDDPRTFFAHYYPLVIPLQQNTGQLTFFNHKNVWPVPIGRMVFQPDEFFSSHLVLLNFTQLPVENLLDMIVDGVQSTSTLPTMFLQSSLKSNITVTFKSSYLRPITVRYWLVSAKCSGTTVLSDDQGMRPIFNYLNDQIKNQNESLEFVRCAAHFSTTEIEDSQFAVQLHSLTGLADLADSMYFYNNRGQVVFGQNNLAGVYSSSGNGKTLINLNNVLVMYESPYAVSPSADFQTPQIEVVSKTVTQACFCRMTPVKLKSYHDWCGSQVSDGKGLLKVMVKFESLTAFNGDTDSYDHYSCPSLSLYHNNSVIRLSASNGQLTFSLNTNSSSKISLKFKPSRQFNDQILLLNFTQPPVNADSIVKVDGVQLNSTSPTMFLQSPSSPTIILSVIMPQTEPITFRWWFINKKCSKKSVLEFGDQAQPILYPNETTRHQQRQTSVPIRCAMHYTTEMSYQFGVDLPSLTDIADPADSLYFYNGQGKVALELNNRAGMYSGGKSVLIDANNAVALYESPYSSSQNFDFKAPLIKAVQAQVNQNTFYKNTLVSVKLIHVENSIHLVVSKDDFVKIADFVFPTTTSMRKLEASLLVPIFSLF